MGPRGSVSTLKSPGFLNKCYGNLEFVQPLLFEMNPNSKFRIGQKGSLFRTAEAVQIPYTLANGICTPKAVRNKSPFCSPIPEIGQKRNLFASSFAVQVPHTAPYQWMRFERQQKVLKSYHPKEIEVFNSLGCL